MSDENLITNGSAPGSSATTASPILRRWPFHSGMAR